VKIGRNASRVAPPDICPADFCGTSPRSALAAEAGDNPMCRTTGDIISATKSHVVSPDTLSIKLTKDEEYAKFREPV
jgi:hypothetical protein